MNEIDKKHEKHEAFDALFGGPHTASCRACGWSSDGASRGEADTAAGLHVAQCPEADTWVERAR